MNRLLAIFSALILLVSHRSYSQYDPQYVETKTSTILGETYTVVKLLGKNNRIKIKYFAAKNYDGTVVDKRYSIWAANKNIVIVSSGTYMTSCDVKESLPVGLCIDNGTVVNENLAENLDGIIIVHANGGVTAYNLKASNLSINTSNGLKKMLDIRSNAFQRAEFIKWAKNQETTVFQTHLLVYDDQIKISGINSSLATAKRRFLAVCKSNNEIIHYVINLSEETSLYRGTMKAYRYLKELEEVESVTFMINLDTGCQNIYKTFNRNGNEVTADKKFQGDINISNAANLLVYYYE